MVSGPTISTTMGRTKSNLREVGLPTAAFAEIMGCPLSSMKAALSGKLYIGAEQELNYYQISIRCAAMMRALHPLAPADWKAFKRLVASDRTAEEVRAAIENIFGAKE